MLASRAEFQAALKRLGVPYWASEANFVLVNIGLPHASFVQAMRTRDVLVRDRSADPGCQGCVRITLGPREHTRRAIAALEASLSEIAWTPSEVNA